MANFAQILVASADRDTINDTKNLPCAGGGRDIDHRSVPRDKPIRRQPPTGDSYFLKRDNGGFNPRLIGFQLHPRAIAEAAP